MDRLGGILRRPIVLAGSGMLALTAFAFIGYRNMPADPRIFMLDRFGYNEIDIAREMLPALAFGIAGLVAWHRRPRNRIGPLMVLIGAAILLKGLQGVPIPAVVSLGIWGSVGPGLLPAILLGILVLVYPTGHFVSRIDRWWAAAAALYFLTVQLAWTLFTPTTRDSTTCWDCRPAFILGYDDYVRLNLRNLSTIIVAGLAISLILLVARRWVRASPPARRVMAPVWLAGSVVGVVAVSSSILLSSIRVESTFVAYVAVPSLGDFLVGRVPIMAQGFFPWVMAGSMLLVPGALLWGLARSHLGQAAVSALAIELGRPRDRPPLVRSLRRALGDPSLELALWSRPARMYVTPDGLPMTLPDPGGDRAVTPLDGGDGPLAAMIHDPALAERQALIDGVSAVAQLALENERLHAEVKAQLEEVRASRQRIVSAADDERRRVERNIHDGAQQRLVSLSLALGMAQARAADASPEVAGTLVEAERELKQAIGELRELARGIHPAILTEAGLGPALESLAEHAPLPVALTTRLKGRLPPLVEATAYFVTAEALTNTAKHASATAATVSAKVDDGWLHLRIADNGTGGADPAGGSGLRGLLDRVAALGGQLAVEDDGAGGTRLEARIPCA
jgi:signal transduction histidine kinase